MRESIRSTWSTDVNKTLSDNHKVLFFVGRTKTSENNRDFEYNAKVVEEAKIYNDIVKTDIEEFDTQYSQGIIQEHHIGHIQFHW